MTGTRQKLIDAAKQRFYRDGFRNVGVDAIIGDVGISKTAFYKHFESKDDLMVGVLHDIDAFLQQHFRQMVREKGGPSALGQLRAVMGVVDELMGSKEFHGCIFVTAAMEFPLPHDPAHQAAAKHKKELELYFYELAERAGATRPGDLASELCMIIEGAYVTRALTQDRGTIGIAQRLAEEVIRRHVPGRAGTSGRGRRPHPHPQPPPPPQRGPEAGGRVRSSGWAAFSGVVSPFGLMSARKRAAAWPPGLIIGGWRRL